MNEANKIIKKFVNMVEQDEMPAEELDFENMSLAAVSDKIMKRIDTKPVASQCELYKGLLNSILGSMKDMPQGERKILAIMKDFKKESL